MIQGGYRPTTDHRDWDFLSNHLPAGVGVPELPPTLNRPVGWVPNQNAPDPAHNIPALPYGCTDYTQSLLAISQTGSFRNPEDLENITHANANGGADIRVAFKAAISLGWFKSFYNVQAQGALDYFDAFRVCLFLGKDEGRAISVGTPWFSEFENVGSDGILPDVTIPPALQGGFFGKLFSKLFGSSGTFSWHNWEIFDYKIINGQTYLCCQSLQGDTYGDHGVHYISRTLINKLMDIQYTNAFAGSQAGPVTLQPFTVNLSWTQYVLSFVRMINNNYIMR